MPAGFHTEPAIEIKIDDVGLLRKVFLLWLPPMAAHATSFSESSGVPLKHSIDETIRCHLKFVGSIPHAVFIKPDFIVFRTGKDQLDGNEFPNVKL